MAGKVGSGQFRRVKVCYGRSGRAGLVTAWFGEVSYGMASYGTAGAVGSVMARSGKAGRC